MVFRSFGTEGSSCGGPGSCARIETVNKASRVKTSNRMAAYDAQKTAFGQKTNQESKSFFRSGQTIDTVSGISREETPEWTPKFCAYADTVASSPKAVCTAREAASMLASWTITAVLISLVEIMRMFTLTSANALNIFAATPL